MTVRYSSKPVLLILLCVLVPLSFQFASATNRCKDGETIIDCGPFADVDLCAEHALLSAEKTQGGDAEEYALWMDFVDTTSVSDEAANAVASGEAVPRQNPMSPEAAVDPSESLVSVEAANVMPLATTHKATDNGGESKANVCGDASTKKPDCETQNCVWVPELYPSCRKARNTQDRPDEEAGVNIGIYDIFKAHIDV